MSYCGQTILALASGIHDSINNPTAQSVSFISGVLTSGPFVGELNQRLSTTFTATGGCISGDFGIEEAAIASLMYQTQYMSRKMMEVMQGGLGFLTLREGDTTVSRESPSKFAAEWRAMKRDTEEDLRVATAQWKRNHVQCVSVDYASMNSWPTP